MALDSLAPTTSDPPRPTETELSRRRSRVRVPWFPELASSRLRSARVAQLVPRACVAYAAATARSGRKRIGRRRCAPPRLDPGAARCGVRACRPHQARTVPVRGGRSCPGGRPDHQDLRVSWRHPPNDPAGGWGVSCLAGRQPDVGAPQLAEALRPAPSDWPFLREAVREALAEGPLTRHELGAAVAARRRFRHLGFAFTDRSWTLMKPLAWQGDMSFGPPREGRATFQRLDINPRWAGLPDFDEAGMRAVEMYFRAYGPATPDHLRYWLGDALGAGRKRIQSWIAAFGTRLAAVDIDGDSTYVLREHLEELSLDGRDDHDTTAARVRPMGPRSRHSRPACRTARQENAGQPSGKCRDRRWTGVRHLVAYRRTDRRCVVHRSGGARARRTRGRGIATRHNPRPSLECDSPDDLISPTRARGRSRTQTTLPCQICVRSRRLTPTSAGPDRGTERLVLSRLTIPDPLRPSFDRICKLGVAGSSPARSILEKSLQIRVTSSSEG